MTRGAVISLASALALAAGCAHAPLDRPQGDGAARGAGARELAQGGLAAYLVRNDAATAARRFDAALARDASQAWARFGASLLARRELDDDGEAAALLALIARSPAHPLAPLVARRLASLAQLSPRLASSIAAGLAASQGELAGLAALRVRAARVAALSALGDREGAERVRIEGGVVDRYTVAGPFGALHALDIDAPFPPEVGTLPARVPTWSGLPDAPTREIPCPDGVLDLEGEPQDGGVHYAAADATLSRGGSYLLSVSSLSTARVFVDGAPVVERRDYARFEPIVQVVPVSLERGRHRILAKLGRGSSRTNLVVALARTDGSPSDARFEAPAPGPGGPSARPASLPHAVDDARALLAELDGAVPGIAADFAAAQDAAETNGEEAKALVEEALVRAPCSAALLALRARLRQGDPTLSDRAGRARAEADLDRALAGDPGGAATRLARAELARLDDRLDEAAALLDALSEKDGTRPRALLARARLASARGLVERAEKLAGEARRGAAACGATELLLDLAARRDAIALEDELAAELARCPGGRERLVEHRRRRGDLAGALALASELVRAAPARVELRLRRARLLADAGEPRAAAEDLAELARTWPREARIEKRRAEHLDEAGRREAARAARRRALLLDGGDLALRRAVALEEGQEPLDRVDEDGRAAVEAYRRAPPPWRTSSVTVLDFGAVEGHPGGAFTERVHTVVEARDERAVDHVGEVAVPEGAELLAARTIKRDGRVLEAEEPLGDKRTLSLAGLEPGDFAEWTWIRTVPGRGAWAPGWSADAFFFRGDTPLWRSVYVAAAPAAVGLEVDAHHMATPALERAGEELRLEVTRSRVPPLVAEPRAPSDAEALPFVQVGSGAGQEAFARAMADAMLELFRPSLEVKVLAREIARDAQGTSDPGALLRAVHRRVGELVLGDGGSFTEPAGSILSRGRGNRTVLTKSLLDALGVRSRLALVREFTRDPAPYRFPRPEIYSYAVLRVEAGGRVFWLDPTIRGAPFGSLPEPLRDAEALVLPGAPGEEVRRVRTPAGAVEERQRTRLEITVDRDGDAVVEGLDELRGYDAAALRSAIERVDASGRRQAMERSLSRSFRGPVLLDVAFEGERDLGGPLVVRWRARVGGWARLDGDRAVVDAPLLPARLVSRFLQRANRETPLLVGAEERSALTLTVRLPEGWRPVPGPLSEVAGGAYGRYRREERADAARLVREDAFDLLRARVAPGELAAFAGFAAAVDAAQAAPIVFRTATPGGTAPGAPGS